MTKRAVVAASLVLVALGGCVRAPHRVTTVQPYRGLWITRWDYRTLVDVNRAIDDAASLGATDVLWQVRGQADAFYASDLEPWGRELLADLPPGATDPGFDPLAAAVTRAHQRGLRLHAWVNVCPLWKGTTPPTNPAQAWLAHPQWRLRDARGVDQALNEHYVVADPRNAAWQAHVVAVCRDIATRYAIDGLHLDYIRFVAETLDRAQGWPGGDEVRDAITALVGRIATAAREARPGVEISAAVLRDPARAREVYLQDAPRWLADGTLDRALPMLYTADADVFTRELAAWRRVADPARLCPGLGVYLQDADQVAPQVAACAGLGGYAVFAYSSLFTSIDPQQDHSEAEAHERVARRAAVRTLFAARGASS